MILTDTKIKENIEKGLIVIAPYKEECLGSNSYDVHIGDTLATYVDVNLDSKRHNKIDVFKIPHDGFVLNPNEFYLGVTKEHTETHKHVPFLEGKSSVGRLGINIHVTAGKGDVGFCNTWTLELSVKKRVRIYSGMLIGQLVFFEISGDVSVPYNKKNSAKYTKKTNMPVESMMWKNFVK